MPEAGTVSAINIEITGDASSFVAAAERAQSAVAGLKASVAGTAKAASAISGGYKKVTLSPAFAVTKESIAGFRVDVNKGLKSAAPVSVPVQLGTGVAGMRTAIKQGIGVIEVPVRLAPGSMTGGVNMRMLAGIQVAASQGGPSPMNIGQATSYLKDLMGKAGVHVEGSRAHGGPVEPNRAYRVGERGPETFVPRTSGTIVSNTDHQQQQLLRALLAEQQQSRKEQHRIRGGDVLGYGGKYGAVRPAPSRTYPEHQDRLWGSPDTDPGYFYHQTDNLRGVRKGSWLGAGVVPGGGQSWWTGGGYPLSRAHLSVPRMHLLRSPASSFPRDLNHFVVGPDMVERPDLTPRGIETASRTVPRRDLQYWGEDNDWRRFRRGRARWGGGPAYHAGGPMRAGAGARALRMTLAQGPGGGGTFPVDPATEVPHSGHAVGISGILGAESYHVRPDDTRGFLRAFRSTQRAGAPFVGTWSDPDTGLIDIDPSTVIRRKREADMVLRYGHEKAAYDLGAGETWYASERNLRASKERIRQIIYGRKHRGGAVHAMAGAAPYYVPAWAKGRNVEDAALKEFQRHLDTLQGRFGVAAVADLSSDSYRDAIASTIAGTPWIDLFKRSLRGLPRDFPTDVATGHFPAGIRGNIDPLKYIAAHEYGHVLDLATNTFPSSTDMWEGATKSVFGEFKGGLKAAGRMLREVQPFPSEIDLKMFDANDPHQHFRGVPIELDDPDDPWASGLLRLANMKFKPGLATPLDASKFFPSGYSTRNENEWFAENFAGALHQPRAYQRPATKFFSEYIEKNYPVRASGGPAHSVGMLAHLRLAEARRDPWAFMALTGEPFRSQRSKKHDTTPLPPGLVQHRKWGGEVDEFGLPILGMEIEGRDTSPEHGRPGMMVPGDLRLGWRTGEGDFLARHEVLRSLSAYTGGWQDRRDENLASPVVLNGDGQIIANSPMAGRRRSGWARNIGPRPLMDPESGVQRTGLASELVMEPEGTWVHQDYRGLGIGPAMYRFAEQQTGVPVIPSGAQTRFGYGMWRKYFQDRAAGGPHLFGPSFGVLQEHISRHGPASGGFNMTSEGLAPFYTMPRMRSPRWTPWHYGLGGPMHALLGAKDLGRFPQSGMEEKLDRLFSMMTPAEARESKPWYPEAREMFLNNARESGYLGRSLGAATSDEGISRAIASAAVLSPRTKFGPNVIWHRTALEALRLGVPPTHELAKSMRGAMPSFTAGVPGIFPANLEKAMSALGSGDVQTLLGQSPKVPHFYTNLMPEHLGGSLDIGTMDAIAAQAATIPWESRETWPQEIARAKKLGIELPSYYTDSPGTGVFEEAMNAAYANVTRAHARRLGLEHVAEGQAAAWVKWRGGKFALGGQQEGHGLYIVGEVGDELFVPNRLSSIIPEHVMKQIPKRDEGGGVFKVGKRGQEYFTPPEDGWIIPHRLMDQVPHAADGRPVNRFSKYDYRSRMEDQSSDPVKRNEENVAKANWEAILASAKKGREDREAADAAAAAARFPGRAAALAATTPTPSSMAVVPPPVSHPPVANAIPPMPVVDTSYAKPYVENPLPRRDTWGNLIGSKQAIEAARGMSAGAFARKGSRPSALSPDLEANVMARLEAMSSSMTPLTNEYRVQAAGSQGPMGARNPKGLAAVLGHFGIGGGKEQAQRFAEFQQATNVFGRTEGRYQREVVPVKMRLEAVQSEAKAIRTSTAEMAKGSEGRKAEIARVKELRAEQTSLNATLKSHAGLTEQYKAQEKDVQEKFQKAMPTQAGIAKNLLAVIGTTSLYGMAMQSVGVAMQSAERVAAPLVDSLGGWHSIATKVTTDMGQLTTQYKGNSKAVVGATAATAGMSSAGMALMDTLLTPTAQAKAGGAAAGNQQNIYRAMAAEAQGKAPEGLSGGYGGLFGTPLLASEVFGGGKGFMETQVGTMQSLNKGMSTDFGAYAAPVGAGLASGGFLGGALAAAQTTIASGGIPMSGGTPVNQKLTDTYLADLRSQVERGGAQTGHPQPAGVAITYTTDEAMRQRAQEAIGKMNLPEDVSKAAVNAAKSGFILTDSAKKAGDSLITAGDTVYQTWKNMSAGAALPTPESVTRQSTWQLLAQTSAATVQAQVQRQYQIPAASWQAALGQGYGAGPATAAAPGGGFLSIAQRMGGAAAFAGSGISMGQYTGAPEVGRAATYAAQGRAALLGQVKMGLNTIPGANIRPDSQSATSPFAGAFDYAGRGTISTFNATADSASNLGKAIGNTVTSMAGLSASLSAAQFANDMRLAKRAYIDALGLAGKASGPDNLGAVQRQQTLVGFKSQQLSIDIEKRSLATQLALASFATPGQTGEERYALMMQTKAEVAQKTTQLGYTQTQLKLGKQAFGIETGRGEIDTKAVMDLTQQARTTSVALEALANQLTDQQAALDNDNKLLKSLADEGLTKFNLKLGAATDIATTLGPEFGNLLKNVKDLDAYIQKMVNPQAGATEHPGKDQLPETGGVSNWQVPAGSVNPLTSATSSGGVSNWQVPAGSVNPQPTKNAAGYLGYHATPTTMTVGEAGGEQVAILRNPAKALLPQPSGSQGGSGAVSVSVNINGTTVRSENDIQSLAQRVAYEVERILGRKASLTGIRGIAY